MEHKHELDRIRPRPVILGSVALVAILIVVSLVVGLFFKYAQSRQIETSAARAQDVPPAPRLQVSPVRDVQEMRASEDKLLTTYGWVDKQQGIVRIPIDRAIEVIASRGLPVRSGRTRKMEP